MIRAALVDDQAIVRAGLARILSPADGFWRSSPSVPTAGKRWRNCLRSGRMVLMDVRMPGPDGIAATAHLRGLEDPSTCSSSRRSARTRSCGERSRRALPGSCFGDSAEDLIAAVGAVAGGGAWFDPGVAPRLLDRYRQLGRSGRVAVTRPGSTSSPTASTTFCA